MTEYTFSNNFATGKPSQQQVNTELSKAFKALEVGNFKLVIDIAKALLRDNSRQAQAHYLIGRVTIETQQLDIALQGLETAVNIDASVPDYWAYLALVYSQVGKNTEAENAVKNAQQLDSEKADVLHPLAYVQSSLGHFEDATKNLIKAVKASPNNSVYHHALGVNLLETGDLKGAQQSFETAIVCNSNDVKSRWLLSSLVTAKDNDLADKIINMMGTTEAYSMHNAFLGYTAGKLFEDTKSWDKAFSAFEQGAKGKRRTVNYDKAQAKNTFETLKSLCTKTWCNNAVNQNDQPGPIFIIGQPRTGSTLIDRIVSSHSLVHSAGEPVQLAMSMRAFTGVRSQEFISAELIHQAQNLSGEELAESYLAGLTNIRGNTPFFIDKFPMNFMLVGFIAKAFPNAKIIHVTRHPMDTCFAVFKQLFEDVYPHSYDQTEMAEHYVMYQDLMAHWHRVLPGKILDVAYENVTNDLDKQARKLIDYLELDWQDTCVDFEKSKTAVVTASAAQVREKVHTRSVGRWKQYEQQLSPTIDILKSAGISI
jgi:tetratricopeptide (TPR) repeat protein